MAALGVPGMTARPSHNAQSAELRSAARHMTRRRLLDHTTAAVALAFGVGLPGTAHAAEIDARRITEDPFTLGIASGDPLPGSVLLWTRLAPSPYEPDGGMPFRRVRLRWEVAHDRRFTRIVRRGTAVSHPELHHSVHCEVNGLVEDRTYYYRFRAGRWISATGRTRTAPAPSSRVAALRFAAVSCQAYHHGYFTPYRHLADEELAVVFHLGDYLYEHPVSPVGGARRLTGGPLPAHFDRETLTLEDYRLRYGLYKSDPDLKAAHAAHPFVLTWDDHETENNYAGDQPGHTQPTEEFLLRRASAYRAYWEHQPLRLPQRPRGPDMRLYRRVRFGRLAQFDVLDTRQYRSAQAYGDGWHPPGPQSEDPARTLTGAAQERWLLDGWRTSRARWHVLAQQVTFARRWRSPVLPHTVSMDAWDGYPASRSRVLAGAEAAGIDRLLVLSGDVHVSYGFDLKADWDDPDSRTLGTEIVTTSISSGGNGTARPPNWTALTTANPHLRHYDGRRGYTVVTLDEDRMRADFRTVTAVTTPTAPMTTAASFISEARSPGLRRV
ncbi:alkaline phosphatase D family protein [Streptomyces sp. NPDC056500]|uniref:alkaline phosphatase D family protein n=1 Tax=Streptomyces sp. NPDC056500 TaxID=3345840 RepID=UPI0036B3A160